LDNANKLNQAMNDPLVSVVIPVYNAGRYLRSALGSIVDQTFSDWEMICIDDGSSDTSPAILDDFASRFPRIQVVHQANAGIVAALNRGCELAKGAYICRMDADDIAMKDRVALQVAYMQEHPDCVALGGAILSMDSDSMPLGIQRLPSQHDSIVSNLLNRHTGVFHPTSMIRRDAFNEIGGYRPEYQWIEDHDLWLRLSRIGVLSNLDQVVLCYRQHASSVCWKRSDTQRELMNRLLATAFAERGLAEPSERLQSHSARTKANPGKWARMAARGGYPRTAFKHLAQLWRELGPSIYSLRMTIEVRFRLPVATAKTWRTNQRTQVPDMLKWDVDLS
jgi:glycosyltransferase involved in cell wall biosynthesis